MGAKLARRLVAALVGVVAAAAWYHWSWPPVSFSYDLWMLAGVLVAPVVVALVLSAPGWKPREIAVSVFLLHAAALVTALRLRWDDTNFGYDVGRELVAFGWGVSSLSAAIGTGALGAGIGWYIRTRKQPFAEEPGPAPGVLAETALRWSLAALAGVVVAIIWYQLDWGGLETWPIGLIVVLLAAPVVLAFAAAAPRCRPIEVAGAVVAFHGALVAAALALRWNDGGFGYDGGREGVVISWGLSALCAALITGAAGAALAWGVRWLDHQHRLDEGR